ncbi:root phototropism protein 3 [Arachis ipaensis]|uniref:root phototropism protein 3 n=1 Tax=Arachis ipaensis TaxID=130454 RepID=UPI000A2AFC7D|nr:root phototropism protein 3 [Arachis ipaensis]
MWESQGDSAAGLISSTKLGVQTQEFHQRGSSWYVSADIPSDLLIQIAETNFHLHKYPLLSRSAKLNRILYDSRDPDLSKIVMDDLPGGPEAFELASKFCYGIPVDLTAGNISGLRCTAEYLEMTEDLEEGNLIFKTEAFLSYVVLSSWRDSILVLKSCEKLSPWAENLQIVRRCSESIAWKACANPKGIRWSYTGRAAKGSSPKWIEMKDSSPSRNQNQVVPPDWWFEDVSILRIDHFVRVMTAIKVKGMRFELIGAGIMHYASKWLPGLMMNEAAMPADESSNFSNSNSSSSSGGGLHMIVAASKEENTSTTSLQAKDQRMIVESLISIIPQQKDSVTCSFLLRLLRMANMLKVAPALVNELEKRVGMQFEQATLGDLLIPCYEKSETVYDVDLVQRVLEHFLVQEQSESVSPNRESFSEKQMNAKARVARLVDSYLTEVSRDRNLSLTKFQVLAEALPDSARTSDDGLYRAVDSYLKAHPTLSEHERKRLCRVMDCQKLSIDACMHAAQNERLPLRVVVQVLFSEQVKISNALANTTLKEGVGVESHQYQPPVLTNRKTLLEGTPQSFQEGWTAAKKDINTLKFELETVKTKYLELQNDMDNLQKQFDKLMLKQKILRSRSSTYIVTGRQHLNTTNPRVDSRKLEIELLTINFTREETYVGVSTLQEVVMMTMKVAPALVNELEKRVGMQFEQATLGDLLIPCYEKSETVYDVDLVQRVLEHFLVQEQSESVSPNRESFSEKQMNAKARVARLVDSYLTEVSRDRNLSLTKFQVLAEALPDSARTSDDGLYRAVDSYLKAHPTLSEHERKRLCRVMDCQKLSIDACMHAAQNERLPLRVVVQVLFSEQVKISNALANTALKEGVGVESHQYQPPVLTNRKTLLEGTPQSFQEGWTAAKKDINTLKFELETVKTKYLELQNDMENLQKQFDKLMLKQKHTSPWTSGWKKLSKLTKITDNHHHHIAPQIPTPEEPHTRKTTRRWRNSIS